MRGEFYSVSLKVLNEREFLLRIAFISSALLSIADAICSGLNPFLYILIISSDIPTSFPMEIPSALPSRSALFRISFAS